MIWFGRKKQKELSPAPEPTPDVPEVEVLLTEVADDHLVLQSRRTYPLDVGLYLNVTASTIESVRSTGLRIWLDETRKLGRTTLEYRGHLDNATPALLDWLRQVRDQGLPNAANAQSYVFLHLDQRCARRSQRQFQVMSPDIPGYKGLTSDISSTGLRMLVPSGLTKGAVVRLCLRFDDFSFDDVEVKAEVLWVMARQASDASVGLRFIDPSEQAKAAIEGYIGFAEGYKKKRFRGA